MTFGEKLQTLRAREGLSQDALAEALDVSRQAVSKWERDEAMPEAEKIVRISRRFGVTTDYLLLEDAPERPASRTIPEPGEVWRKYGFLLGWALAVWGGWRCLRLVPTMLMIAGADWGWGVSIYLIYALPYLSTALSGVLIACLWHREGVLRRRHVGLSLMLWSGLPLAGLCLRYLLFRQPTSSSNVTVIGEQPGFGGLALWLCIGVLVLGAVLWRWDSTKKL